MIKDRVAIDLPDYLHVCTGHYVRDSTYSHARAHGTDDYLLIATLNGGGRFTVDKQSFTTAPQELVLIKPGAVHDYRTEEAVGNWDLLWAHFHPRPHWYDWLNWPETISGTSKLAVTNATEWENIVRAMRQMHRHANSLKLRSVALAMNSLERCLLLCSVTDQEGTKKIDERIIDIIDYLVANLAESVVIEALADRVHLSPSRLAHLFKQETGRSPIDFLDTRRIERAKVLLERTSERIGEIGQSIGMDAVTFSTRFKGHTGLSPRQFRNKSAQERRVDFGQKPGHGD